MLEIVLYCNEVHKAEERDLFWAAAAESSGKKAGKEYWDIVLSEVLNA